MSAALLSLCERRSGEDIWDLNALRASIAAVGDDIAELKNAINSIMETVAVTCYINPAEGHKNGIPANNNNPIAGRHSRLLEAAALLSNFFV